MDVELKIGNNKLPNGYHAEALCCNSSKEESPTVWRLCNQESNRKICSDNLKRFR